MRGLSPDLFPLLNEVAKVLVKKKRKAYLVGGFVRDLLLERKTNDIDISIDVDAIEIAKEISDTLGGRYVLLDGITRVARVVVLEHEPPLYFDFSSFPRTITEDLARRDFSIDAMAIDLTQFLLNSWCVIDPFQGEMDIKNKMIRAVDKGIFKDDPVRLLRAFRLAAELGFNIERDTGLLIKQDAVHIRSASGERQREELIKIFGLPACGRYLRDMDKVNLLTRIIPELEELRGVEQPGEHYWDVLNHSLEAVSTVEFLVREREWEYDKHDLLEVTPWSQKMKCYFDEKVSSDSNRRIMLKLGALLHDIAKPQTKTIDTSGRTRFIGHAQEGAARTIDIMTRLRFSNREIKLVYNLVYYHLRPVQIANSGMPTSRAIYRYFRDVGDAGIDILFLSLADYLAARGPKLNVREWEQHNDLVNHILNENQSQKQERLPLKLINGHAIMDAFGLTSGPLIGKLLRLVYEAQAVGEIETSEEAIDLVRKTLKEECYNN